MKKYRIYFTEKGKIRYKRSIEDVFGYNSEDAILRSGFDPKLISSIDQVFL